MKAYVVPTYTVFSIDASTGKPHMSVDQAQNLAAAHIYRYGSNLLMKSSMEDLKQDLMMKLCSAQFNPAKSSAKTFAITCFGSVCGNIYNKQRAKGKDAEIPDFQMEDQCDGEKVFATVAFSPVDLDSPESEMMLKQEMQDVDMSDLYEPHNWKKTQERIVMVRNRLLG